MKKIFLCFLFYWFANSIMGQTPYDSLISQATELYKSLQFKESALKFTEAFNMKGIKIPKYHRYNAACSWARAGNADSAFNYLNYITTIQNYDNHQSILTDIDFNTIHTDSRWLPLIKLIYKNWEKSHIHLNQYLIRILDTVLLEDQYYRTESESIETKFGADSKEYKDQWKRIHTIDSLNIIKVTKILDQYGWLGADSIGDDGNIALFLVIQHANIDIQKKYLPIARKAVKKGNLYPGNLALLEDRVLVGKGKKQIYGSQILKNPTTHKYDIAPLRNPKKVDERRTKIGLEPMATYVKNWGIQWDNKEGKTIPVSD